MTSLGPGDHLLRARAHAAAAEAIEGEWATVAYFYAAYQFVRHLLRHDPVFADIPRLKGYDLNLVPDDRGATVHQARRGSGVKSFGVNDLVRLLYPTIAEEYLLLHQMSVSVRYGAGVPDYVSRKAPDALAVIRGAVDSGLVAK